MTSVDRGGGHIGLPLSDQCVRVSEGVFPAVSIVQVEAAPANTRR